jgi:hypothetical protein
VSKSAVGFVKATWTKWWSAFRRRPWAFLLEGLLIWLFFALATNAQGIANGVESAAWGCAMLVAATSPGRRFRLAAWCFLGGLVVFFATGVVATWLGRDALDAGRVGWGRIHLFSAALACAAGFGVRGPKAAERLLNILLVVFGVWYVFELVRIPFRDPFLRGRLTGTR